MSVANLTDPRWQDMVQLGPLEIKGMLMSSNTFRELFLEEETLARLTLTAWHEFMRSKQY